MGMEPVTVTLLCYGERVGQRSQISGELVMKAEKVERPEIGEKAKEDAEQSKPRNRGHT